MHQLPELPNFRCFEARLPGNSSVYVDLWNRDGGTDSRSRIYEVGIRTYTSSNDDVWVLSRAATARPSQAMVELTRSLVTALSADELNEAFGDPTAPEPVALPAVMRAVESGPNPPHWQQGSIRVGSESTTSSVVRWPGGSLGVASTGDTVVGVLARGASSDQVELVEATPTTLTTIGP